MSGFLSPKMMRFREAAERGLIEDDRPCEGCGYNLRGLPYGRPCPECGHDNAGLDRGAGGGSGVPRIGDLLLKSDTAERARWKAGFWLAGGAVLAMVLARILEFAFTAGGSSRAFAIAYQSLGGVNALVFIIATFLLTPPVLGNSWAWMRSATLVTRIGSVFWIPAFGIAIVDVLTSGQFGPVFTALGVGCRVLAAAAACVLFFQMHVVALFSECEGAAHRLNNLTWLGPIATVVLWPFAAGQHWIVMMFEVPILGIWSWMMGWGVFAFHELAQHLRWADRHAIERVGRDERVRAKKDAHDRAARAQVRTLPIHDDGEITVSNEPSER